MSNGDNILARAFFRARQAYPYFSRGFAALRTQESKDVPTLGISNGWRLYWNREFMEKNEAHWPGLLRHELEHLLRSHSARCKALNAEPLVWNIAGDAEINDDFKTELPSDCVLPEQFKMEEGLSAETYYHELIKNAKIIHISPPNCAGGSGAGNPLKGEMEEGGSDKKEGEGPGVEKDLNEAQSSHLKEMIAQDVQDYAQKNRGTVPAGVQLWAEALLKARPGLKLPTWREKLKDYVTTISGRDDWSWARTARSSTARCPLPGMIRLDPPPFAVVVDTSGSCSGYAEIVAEVMRRLLVRRPYVTMIACDAEVYPAIQVRRPEQVKLAQGGGGTDMRIGIEAAYEKYKAKKVLVITDGYTPWPENWPKSLMALIVKGMGDDDVELKIG